VLENFCKIVFKNSCKCGQRGGSKQTWKMKQKREKSEFCCKTPVKGKREWGEEPGLLATSLTAEVGELERETKGRNAHS
jgi:hypothetical protein